MDPTSPGMGSLRLGSPRLEEFNKRYASPEALEFRIQEIKRLEAELLDERIHLQVLANRKHNQNERLVPVGRLPDEVLQTILYWDHVRLESTPRVIPFRNAQLMAVSHRWMGIVLDYAHLWTTVVVVVRNSTSTERLRTLRERTRNFIRRSKQSKMFILMSLGVNEIVEELLKSCFTRCSRLEISAFNITDSPTEPIYHASLFSNLRDLTLKAHKKERGADVLVPLLPGLEESGCRLERLTLTECEYDGSAWFQQIPLTFYQSSLISLTIRSSLDPLGIAQLLQSCSQLQYVYYTRDNMRALEEVKNFNASPRPPIDLRYLQSLTICAEWDILDRFWSMCAPNLAHLEINASFQAAPRSRTEVPEWLLTHPRSPPSATNPTPPPVARFPSIKVLTLRNHAEWTTEGHITLLRLYPQLEYLYTDSLHEENLESLSVLSQPAVSPRLHTLTFELFPEALHEDTLVEMLAQAWLSRRHGSGVSVGDDPRSTPTPMPKLKVKVSGHWTIRNDWPKLRMRLRHALDLPDNEPMEGKPFEIPVL